MKILRLYFFSVRLETAYDQDLKIFRGRPSGRTPDWRAADRQGRVLDASMSGQRSAAAQRPMDEGQSDVA